MGWERFISEINRDPEEKRGDDKGLEAEGDKIGEPGITDGKARGPKGGDKEFARLDDEGDGDRDTGGDACAPKVNATSRRACGAS